jgi:hypothetical protein
MHSSGDKISLFTRYEPMQLMVYLWGMLQGKQCSNNSQRGNDLKQSIKNILLSDVPVELWCAVKVILCTMCTSEPKDNISSIFFKYGKWLIKLTAWT